MKKPIVLALLMSLALMTIFTFSSENETPVSTNRLNVIAPWEINSLDLNQSGVIFQRMNLVETLVEADLNGELKPSLAIQWASNGNATKWRFTLRPSVQFHNSEPLTAQAVANSLNIAKSKPSILQKAFIEQIIAVSEHDIEIHLSQPLTTLPSFLTHYSTAILAEQAYDEQGNITELIGTGAFKPTQIEAPQKLIAHRFEHYWSKQPALHEVHYLASSRSETRALMAQSDPHSLVFNLDSASLERLKNDLNIAFKSTSIARTIQLKMDIAKPFFRDLAIRQALSEAIDRQNIANFVLKIDNGIANQILPPLFSEWRIASQNHSPNITKIKENLTASGYRYLENGQLTDAQGNPFRFTLRTFSDRPELPIIATILQAQWKQIGIDVNVAVGNFSDIPAGHQDGTLEMALYAFNYGKTLDPLSTLLQAFSPNGNDWGVMNWQHQDLQSAFSALEQANDPSQIKALKQQISEIIHAELPIIPIVYYQQNAVFHHPLQNVVIDPFERRFYLEQLQYTE